MFYFFRDAPDVSTRLAIYLYYRDKDIYRQMEINLINTKYIRNLYILKYKIINKYYLILILKNKVKNKIK